MPKTILFFEIKAEKKTTLTNICKSQGIRTLEVRPSDYQQTLGYLAGITGFSRKKTSFHGDKLADEMMVFSGMDSESLDQFLDACRASGMPSGRTRVHFLCIVLIIKFLLLYLVNY